MARNKKKKKASRVLFILEILILLLFIGGLFVYGQINSKLGKISKPDSGTFNRDELVVNSTVKEQKEQKEQKEDTKTSTDSTETGKKEKATVNRPDSYTTIALFALDKRSKTGSEGGLNSDTIIIASINDNTKEVRLASVYRDTLLDIGDNTYQKCNAAYAFGGPQQAVSMLNANLDLDIENYATVDFSAMVRVIDMMGGLDIPLTYQEMVHMNNYSIETSEETETDYTPIELPDPKPEDETEILGTYHLDGVQATSYCRIRYTASMDMGRTERQRLVIKLMAEKAKKTSLPTLSAIMDEVFPMVETSFSKGEILKMAMGLLSYEIVESKGFPECYRFADLPSKGSVIVPASLETNVNWLHYFLYPTFGYEPSAEVHERSETMIGLTGYGPDGEMVGDGVLEQVIEALDSDYGIQVAEDQSYYIYEWGSGYIDPGTVGGGTYVDPNAGGSYTDPGYTDPGYTDPGYTDSGYVDPGYTDSGYVDPGYVDPGYADPGAAGGDIYVDPNAGGTVLYEEPYSGGGELLEDPNLTTYAAVGDGSDAELSGNYAE